MKFLTVTFVGIVSFAIIYSTMSTQVPSHFLKIGHRGACGYEPENTLRSFQKAIDLNVDAIELDVYCCKSGELVVFHDKKLDRTTNGHGYIEEKTLTELKQLDAGKGEKIPTLDEVFQLVDRRVIINIELKGPNTAIAVAQLINRYVHQKEWTWDHFIVSSFDHYELKRFAKLCPRVKRGALIEGITIGYAKFGKQVNASAICISSDFITKEYVQDAHARGLLVFVYTVNDPDDIAIIKKLGVDGIFSNYPDRL
jgi:glycerophosphoryl diester phosphodiesterase